MTAMFCTKCMHPLIHSNSDSMNIAKIWTLKIFAMYVQLRWGGVWAEKTDIQTDSHTNTSSLSFYRPDALPDARSTVSTHSRQYIRNTILLIY